MPTCQFCKQSFAIITNTHLKFAHKTDINKYRKKFGPHGLGFKKTITQFPKDHPKYLKWRESLLKRPASWSKGYTKATHPSVAKISVTFKKKKIDNFKLWREEAKKRGLIPSSYPDFQKNKNLAFLIGMILGDGNLYKFPRTEGLRITLGTDKPKLWKYTARIAEEVFQKKPYVYKHKQGECMVISLYQKDLSKRLGVPLGERTHVDIKLPEWILREKTSLIACLRGLYEAEGSFNIHKPTYTYKLIFANRNDSLLGIVYDSLIKLGFHPHRSKDKVQVSKKAEVFKLKELLSFRKYA